MRPDAALAETNDEISVGLDLEALVDPDQDRRVRPLDDQRPAQHGSRPQVLRTVNGRFLKAEPVEIDASSRQRLWRSIPLRQQRKYRFLNRRDGLGAQH